MSNAESLSTSLWFEGVRDNTKKYDYGDIVIEGDITYIYLGNNQWEEMCKCDSIDSTNSNKKIMSKSHCKSCGAPVNPYHDFCEYCGVYYTEF